MNKKLSLLLFLFCYVVGYTQTIHIISDTTWKGRNTFPGVGWLMPGYSDASWSRVTAPNPENVIPVVPGSLSMWQRPNRDSAFVRKTFTIPVGDSYSGTMLINADNAFYVFFNGVYAGSGTDWYSGPFTFTITPSLTGCAENVIAIIVVNYGGPFGCSLVSDINVVNPLYTPVTISPLRIDCNGFISAWNTVPTATGYYLDVSTDSMFGSFLPGYNNRSMGTDTSLFIGSLTTGASYYYRVRCTRGLLTSCNSNVTRVVTTSLPITNRNLFICGNDSIFLQRAWRSTTGIYRDTFVLASGCDSVVANNLTVYPTYLTTRSVTICDNDSVRINGVWQHSAGVYRENNRSIHACDSVVDITVSTIRTHYTAIANICSGERYFVGGGFQTSAGIYSDTYRGFLGCDSRVSTTLVVNPISRNARAISICNDQTYFVAGAFHNTSGSYYDTLINFLGCDSILRTDLTVLPVTTFTRNIDICDGQSYFAGGIWRTVGGAYYDTLSNYLSCDSVLQTNLTILPTLSSTISASICSGDSLFVGGGYQKIAGSYFDTLVSHTGCDSILQTNLSLILISSGRRNAEICRGDSFYAGGLYQKITGIYYDSMRSYRGCDSVLMTQLLVNLPVLNIKNVHICEGDGYIVGGIVRTMAGIYYDTATSFKGCDSILQINISVLTLSDTTFGLIDICAGELWEGVEYMGDTTIGNHFRNTNGCDSVHIDSIHFHQKPIVTAGEDQVIGLGETAVCIASGAMTYQWSNGDNTYAIKVSPIKTTSYTVIGMDSNACLGVDTVTIIVREPTVQLLIPTAFSPNGDGVNDLFRILNYYDFNVKEFGVYDRWGELVYDGANNNMMGWDGIFKNREQPIGVYSYFVSGVSKKTNKTVTATGNVTLVR